MGFTAGYKVNEGTDYEFTVSDETISEVVLDTGISESDIASYCYSALIDSRIETVKAESHTDRNQPGWPSWCVDNAMFYYIDNTRHINSNTGINNTSDTVYERNFLVWYGTIYPGEPEEKTGWFLIMDIKDIKKFYVDFSSAGFSQSSVASTRTDSGVTTPFTGYTGDAYLYQSNLAGVYPDIYQNDDTLTTIRVINVLNINEELWIGRLNPSNYGEQTTGETKYGYSMYIDYYDKGWLSQSDPDHFFQKGTTNWSGIPKIYDMEYPDLGFDVSPTIETYAESDNMLIRVDVEHYGGFNVVSDAVVGTKTLDGILTWMSWCGLLFKYGGTTYKPIIENGVIVGYSSDMFAPSEFDTMTNVTGNNISPVPPGPVPPSVDDEDNNDPINTTGAPFSSGIAHYYITTAGSLVLQHISEALGAWDLKNTGKDLFKNLISCKLIKPPTAVPSASGVFTIYGEKPQYNGADITISEVTGNPDQAFGPYAIPRKFNDFRDFAPYSKAEIFLPYCGWCGLPSHVIGRSVTVKYFTDIIAATCKAIVFCGNNIVAEAAGVIGCDIPMAADNVGMKMAGATTGLLAIVSGGVQTGAGAFNLMTGNIGRGIGGVLSGLSKVASGYAQSAMSLNENATEICGKNGDGCCIAGTTHIIIKITRPKEGAYTTAPFVPSGFAHSTGFLSNKEVTVGSVTGLLIADNVDTSGIGGATDAERAEIKRVLESGLIVNSAPVPPEP